MHGRILPNVLIVAQSFKYVCGETVRNYVDSKLHAPAARLVARPASLTQLAFATMHDQVDRGLV
jgi:hypothetical protein